MTANTRGALFVKADRVNERIDDMTKLFLGFEKNKDGISHEEFKDFIRSVHLIINTELNEKGVERKWKK